MQKAYALTRKTSNAKEGTEGQFFADGTLAAEPLGVELLDGTLDWCAAGTLVAEPLDVAEIRLM